MAQGLSRRWGLVCSEGLASDIPLAYKGPAEVAMASQPGNIIESTCQAHGRRDRSRRVATSHTAGPAVNL